MHDDIISLFKAVTAAMIGLLCIAAIAQFMVIWWNTGNESVQGKIMQNQANVTESTPVPEPTASAEELAARVGMRKQTVMAVCVTVGIVVFGVVAVAGCVTAVALSKKYKYTRNTPNESVTVEIINE